MKRLLIGQGLLVGFLFAIHCLTGVGSEDSPRVIDLSLLVSPELPCTAPVTMSLGPGSSALKR